MDITIRSNFCGNKSCIGVDHEYVEDTRYGRIELIPRIVIEDVWEEPVEVIERAMVGLISHETIEYLLFVIESGSSSNMHDLIGKEQSTESYLDNTDGIVLGDNCARELNFAPKLEVS